MPWDAAGCQPSLRLLTYLAGVAPFHACSRTVFFPTPRLPKSSPASSLHPLHPWHSLAPGCRRGGSASSRSCPLPRAPLGRRCRSFPAGASRGQCGLNAATSAFCCLPSPAFGRLQVTASQGALKVLCSHFLLL